MQLRVPFSEIPEHGIECEIKDSSWFPGDLLEQVDPVDVHVRLTKKNDNRIELKGALHTSVMLECDRCLKKFIFQVEAPMQLVVEVAEQGEHWKLQDLEPTEAVLETISQHEPVVDMAELLLQQLYLALPEKRLCMEKCSGLCPQCGTDLNEGNCECDRQAKSSPFAVLESLKKK